MTTEAKPKSVKDITEEILEKYTCPIKRSLYFTREFLAGPMCGKCFPCSMGAYEAQIRLENIARSFGSERDVDAIRSIAQRMLVMSMCKKGKDTARFLLDNIDLPEFMSHVKEDASCPGHECKAFIEYRNVPDNCIRCGKCQEACKYDAIHGEKQMSYKCCYLPFEIRQKRCVKCGECIKVCPSNAIVVVDINSEVKV